MADQATIRVSRGTRLMTAVIWTGLVIAGLFFSSVASAQAPEEVAKARLEARSASDRAAAEQARWASDPESDFDTHVARQASLEVQLGLRLYREFDDYRAITALTRYRLLSQTPDATFLSSLMIGQIYHRNDKPELAIASFERALQSAPTDYHRTFTYLIGLQEACLPMSLYVACRTRLGALDEVQLQPQLRQLVDYQLLYTDVVLRSDSVTRARLDSFAEPSLAEKASGLLERDRAFDDLSIKRPWLSGTLSALLPGAGQLYNGRPVDALLAFGINGALGAGTYLAFAELESVPLGVVLAVITAGFYGGNIVNAVTDSKRINAERYRAFFEQLKLDYWPRVAFRIDDESVVFTYGFDWPGPKFGDDQGSDRLEPTGSRRLDDLGQ